VRFIWSAMTETSAHREQAFSVMGQVMGDELNDAVHAHRDARLIQTGQALQLHEISGVGASDVVNS
jgi:hypothetical protein